MTSSKTTRPGLDAARQFDIRAERSEQARARLAAVHIHDLRHTGNQFTANAGANTRELMVRMGHDSERAARIYLHSPDKRQRALADAGLRYPPPFVGALFAASGRCAWYPIPRWADDGNQSPSGP